MDSLFLKELHSCGLNVLDRNETEKQYGKDTGSSLKRHSGAVVISHSSQVKTVIDCANKHKVSIWPISGGRNFGYGTSLPAKDGSYILDLSGLQKVSIDRKSGIATIEPGVTQHILHSAIRDAGLDLLVPTTGVGHNGNILGNAMDGGYGLTPIVDHFDSISHFEGYWGNGSPFNHMYKDLGCNDMADKWAPGTGPSWFGILRQGNFGIVTKASVQLARKPEAVRIIIFEWKDHDTFIKNQDELNRLVEEIPGIGGIMMMNDTRVLSTQLDTPLASSLKGDHRKAFLKKLAKERKVSPWTGIGTLYGSKRSVSGAISDIRRRLPECRVWSFTPSMIRALQWLESVTPKVGFVAMRRHLGMLVNSLGTVEGYPITAFLKIAYALKPKAPKPSVESHPAKDECGILWYAPLVQFDSMSVQSYVEKMSLCLTDNGFDPLIAVTSRSARVHCGTIPVLYDKSSPEDTERAKKCYRQLVRTGLENGWPPYRIGIDYMDEIACDRESSTVITHAALKEALDKNNVVAPGRYQSLYSANDDGDGAILSEVRVAGDKVAILPSAELKLLA